MLVSKPRGSSGFGYDPIFVPAGWERTMAELSDEEKDRISHRGSACAPCEDPRRRADLGFRVAGRLRPVPDSR